MADMNDALSVSISLVDNMSSSLGVITNKLEGMKGKLDNTAKSGEASFASLVKGIGTTAKAFGVFSASLTGVGLGVAKLITDFQNNAIAAGDLARKLGITTEQASALREMASDLGIQLPTLEMAFRMMANKGIEPSIEGLVQVKAKLEAAHSPAAKLALAQDLLGRSGGDLIPVLDQLTNQQLRGYIDNLTAAQTVTEEEYQQAIKNREKIDELSDAYESAKLSLGGFLANGLLPWLDVMKGIPTIVGRAKIAAIEFGASVPGATEEFKAYAKEQSDAFYNLATNGPPAYRANAEGLKAGTDAAGDATNALDKYANELDRIAAMGDIQVTTTNRIRTIREGWKGLGDQVKDVADRVLREGGDMWNQALTEIDEHTGTTAKAQADLTKDIEDAFKKLKGGGSIESFGAQIDEIGRDLGFGDSLATMEKNFQDAATQANYYLATIPDVTNKYVYINTIYTGGGGPPKGPPSVPMTMMTAAQWAAYLAAHPPGGPAGGGIFDLGSGDWLKHGLAGGGTLDAFDAMLSEWRPVGELGEEGMLVKNGRVTIVPHNRWENMKRRGLRPGGGFRLGGVPEDIYIPPPPTVDLTDIDLANLYPPPGGVPDWAKDKSQYSSDYTHPAPPAPRPAAPAEQIQINLAVQQKAEAAKQAADQLAELKSINSGIRDLKRIIPVATRDAVLAANPGGIRSG